MEAQDRLSFNEDAMPDPVVADRQRHQFDRCAELREQGGKATRSFMDVNTDQQRHGESLAPSFPACQTPLRTGP
jgi:hypothetical protein